MIKKTILTCLFVLICSFSITSLANEYHDHATQEGQNYLLLRLVGTGSMYKTPVPGLEGDAMCFDIDLVDAKTNNQVGWATDCLSDVQPKGDGLSVLGTTFFYLQDGHFATRGKITAQPVLEETTLESGQPITHVTGASGTGNTIIEGSGRYENSSGNGRLSGMLDMSQFAMNEGDLLTFDCLFLVRLD